MPAPTANATALRSHRRLSHVSTRVSARAPSRIALLASAGAAWLLCSATAAWAQPPQAPGLLWFADGRPSQAAQAAVKALNGAGTDGLEPHDYDADGLQRALAQLVDTQAAPPDAAQRFDGALTGAMKRYLSDLHRGRVDPRKVHANFSVGNLPPFDPESYLRNAMAANRLADAMREAAPSFPLYGTLRDALAKYRKLAAEPFWKHPLPAIAGGKLNPGQAYSGLAQLAQRLEALGDLLPAGTAVPQRYEGALVDAVKAFQTRHALDADGVIGAGTLAQLNVTPAARVDQIALTMERLRWTPLTDGPRMIVVNVPEFVLRAYDYDEGKLDIKLEMKVIVGKALDTRTPLFKEDMRYIEFSPYWNVPSSIARKEVIPKSQRDPGYFTRQGFEFVYGTQANATFSQANVDAVLNGQARIRQRPGPLNALGDIKFIFPNNQAIYLHHTPTPQLFNRGRRDFSHGCIRVEDPVALAQFTLQGMPEWTPERIREAMTAGKSKTVALQQPVPVVLAYGTAIARADGRVYFVPDIYGQDKLLDQALRQRTGAKPAVRPS
ncbi:L,D-transpeptidase family protein [Cupriavidus pauculus]|uniref:Murein L,D-transpeptidase n=1 Tax=Cupriavidus pauculus TaxID=82633 RepID=A0A2N5C4T4_9BURK|nr:L,D-transpeptidase family protein [Cupriavidus pauculus]PLP97229.1 murein L,D-transpeptidase [Cupriavidus pauculus]